MNVRKSMISIDSRFRDKSKFADSSFFEYYLKSDIRQGISIRVASVEFPNVFYSITNQRKNNYFTLVYGSNTFVVSLLDGSYDNSAIELAINDALIPVNLATGLTFSFTINNINGKCTFTEASNSTFSINFTNNSTYDSLGFTLGFRKNIYNNMSQITSETFPNLSGDNYVYLNINNYGDMETATTKTGIIAKIILLSTKGGITFENCSNFITKEFVFPPSSCGTSIKKFSIELLDFNGNRLDMLGFDYSVTVEIIHI